MSELQAGGGASKDILIGFDGEQLIVRTDIPAVHEYVTDVFRHMLASELVRLAGTLGVFAMGDGYRMESAETSEIAGGEMEYMLNLVKAEVRNQFMRARPDLLWLHSAAVERNGTAMLLAAPSGQGKSTLTSMLCRRGWRLMSDDAAPVRMDRNEVVSFCQTVVMRIPRDRIKEPHRRVGLDRHKVELGSHEIRVDPAPIGTVVFLAFSRDGALSMRTLTKGETAMALLRNSMNLIDQKAGGVARAAELAQRLQGFSLSYGSSSEAADLLDSLP